MNRMQLMSVAFLFMGVGTLSAQTESTKEASPGQGKDMPG